MMRKVFSVFVCIVMCFFLTAFPNSTSATEKMLKELVEKRSEFGKHFDNEDGTITAYISSSPLHFLKNDEWVEIDNTLIKDENGNYTNCCNPMKVTLAASNRVLQLNEIDLRPMASIDYNEYQIKWCLVDESNINSFSDCTLDIYGDDISNLMNFYTNSDDYAYKTITSKVSSSAWYKELLPHTDINIELSGNAVKESIVLKDNKKLPEQISYYISCDKMTAALNSDKSIEFKYNDETIFIIPPPYMIDQSTNSKPNYNINVELHNYNDGFIVRYIPSMEWLNSVSTIYPVIIDPTVVVNSTPGLDFRYNSEANPTSTYSSNPIRIGNEPSNNYQAYLQIFDSFTSYGQLATIEDATLHFYYGNLNNTGLLKLRCYANKTQPMNVSWNNDSTITTAKNVKIFEKYIGNDPAYSPAEFSLTEITQAWLNYTNAGQMNSIGNPNYGLKFDIGEYGVPSTLGIYTGPLTLLDPYLTITYSTTPSNQLLYAGYKYNNLQSIDAPVGTIYNFQNRMNCYAYALQIYYRGYLSAGQDYWLSPGEIGLPNNPNISNYASLMQLYSQFTDSNIEYMDFVEDRMFEDSQTLNFNLTRLNCTNAFTLNDTEAALLDSSGKRIIAMVVGKSGSNVSFHFYLRNGNGTCKNGHGGHCSEWTHKPGSNKVKNTTNSSVPLCDSNIYVLSRYSIYANSPEVRYYSLDLDTNLYNMYNLNGHYDSCTGTPVY